VSDKERAWSLGVAVWVFGFRVELGPLNGQNDGVSLSLFFFLIDLYFFVLYIWVVEELGSNYPYTFNHISIKIYVATK
jgi:hypothetical protein